MIEVKNLVKKYGNHIAVNDISFTIEPGRIYGFLGPNGAGKSTTMNIMTGYIGATKGDVIVNGFNILEEPEKAKQCIGYLPEQPPLYTEMTVTEYLKFVAELKGIAKKEVMSSVEEVCDLIKLEEVEERLIKNLSKGYKQRVGLAGAIIGFPEIIILDEPMVGLDPKQILEIRELIRQLSEKHTVILSSHILAEIKEICDYVIIINKGKIVASDTPEQLETVVFGKEEIEIIVKAQDVKQVEAVFNEIKGIESYEYTLEDGYIDVLLQTTLENAEICEELSVAFVNAGMPIKKLNMNKATLEDIFLELTASTAESSDEDSDEEVDVEEEYEEEMEMEGEEDESDL